MDSPQESVGNSGGLRSTDAVEIDADSDAFLLFLERTRDSASLAIVSVVATVFDRGPLELAPLDATIDTGALEKPATGPSSGRENHVGVSFRYEGCDVTVSGGVDEVDVVGDT